MSQKLVDIPRIRAYIPPIMVAKKALVRSLETLPAGVGPRIRLALDLLGYTQAELALATRMDDTKLSKCLKGYRPFSPIEQERIAAFLDLPLAVLFVKKVA